MIINRDVKKNLIIYVSLFLSKIERYEISKKNELNTKEKIFHKKM